MNQFKSDILILGAGAAGIAAVAELASSNLSVKVIEARNRIGGRIFTIKDAAPFPVELGAEFLHGKEKHLWNLMEHYQMRLGEVADTNWFASSNGLEYDHNFYLKMAPCMDLLLARAKAGEDQSLEEFARELKVSHPDLVDNTDRLVDYIEDYTTAEAHNLSLQFIARAELASYTIGQGQLRPLDGYIELLNRLAQQYLKAGQLHLNTRVETVEWSRGTVFVNTISDDQKITFEAKKALITLPLGVLKLEPGQKGAVIFAPPLSAKKDAFNGLAMGQTKRVVATFKRRFWSDLPMVPDSEGNIREWGLLHCKNAPISHWWSQYPDHTHQLIGWCNGQTPPQFVDPNKNALRQLVIDSLSQIFGLKQTEIDNFLANIYFHDWNNDPFTMGVYSYCLPGAWDAPIKLAQQIDDTLFFAGEATDRNGFTGTVHGALRSGLRAAEEILRVSTLRLD